MPMQQHQPAPPPPPHHRRGRRRASTTGSDGASALAQLTRGLTTTYAQCRRERERASPPPQPSQPSTMRAKPSVDATPTTHKTKSARQHSTPKANSTASTPSTAGDAAATHRRRVLTKKTRPSGNNGLDNEEQNLIVRARDVFGGRDALPVQPEFVVLDLLGQGTFGQVFRCQNTATKELVAIKVIRNHPSYYKQAIVEVQITRLLNASYTADEGPHFVRLKDTFEFRNHLCIVFELLSINVYELIAENNFNGFPLEVTRGFQQQILHALVRMDEIGVIHCDLKPENILLVGQDRFLSDVVYQNDPQMARLLATSDANAPGAGTPTSGSSTSARLAAGRTPYIKVVDFGSACMENETVYSYIQSRFYRSPEVLLGIPYTGAIDLWSLGCIAVEMFLGLPLFPGVSEHDQLRLIEDTLGKLPQELLRKGRNVLKFYNVTRDNLFVLKTPAEFARDTQAEVQVSKKYFKYTKLEDMVHAYPFAKHATEAQRRHERARRDAFLHFVRGLLRVDPLQRWSARTAMRHPFITGAPLDRDFVSTPQVVSPSSSCLQPSPCCAVVAPHQPSHGEFAPHSVEHAWPSPVERYPHHAYGSEPLPETPTYSSSSESSIWGPSGMPPYAPQQPHGDQRPLSPTAAYYGSHYVPQQHQHYQDDHRTAYAPRSGDHHKPTKVTPLSPSSHAESASTRVYPYDPYSDAAQLHKAYADAALQAYSPSSAYAPAHCKVAPSSASDGGFPVVPLSPYEAIQPDYDPSLYYAASQAPTAGARSLDWTWGEASYDAAPPLPSTSNAGRSPYWATQPPPPQNDPDVWPRHEELPRHHQYMPDSQLQTPARRGKRQHTNSWDSGDTRELRRHEAAHPHVQPRQGYPQHQLQQQPQYHGMAPPPRGPGVSSRGSTTSTGSRSAHHHHTTPRKHDHKARSGAGAARTHHRKSPRAVGSHGGATQQQHYLHQQQFQPPPAAHRAYVPTHEFTPRDHAAYQSQQPPQSYGVSFASAPKRDESAGVCSVEEKFSSVMSLDLGKSAVALPT